MRRTKSEEEDRRDGGGRRSTCWEAIRRTKREGTSGEWEAWWRTSTRRGERPIFLATTPEGGVRVRRREAGR
jgi:hypothetical protein